MYIFIKEDIISCKLGQEREVTKTSDTMYNTEVINFFFGGGVEEDYKMGNGLVLRCTLYVFLKTTKIQSFQLP
jgi:hypothetical protein